MRQDSSPRNVWDVLEEMPVRAGTSLKPEHYGDVLETTPPSKASWFEVHAENYMGAGGPPHHYLGRIREDYPLSVHGVGLSIGRAAPLNEDHLARLKDVVHRYEPALVSEHLAWSSHGPAYFPDLLPVPYTAETLGVVADHIDRVQEVLGRQILLENPATYIVFETSTLSETDFLTEIVRMTGCALLLDINNVHVSATNHNFDAKGYLREFPLKSVAEIHLAGHAEDHDETGAPLLIDSHDRAISDPVWNLYRDTLESIGPIPTLIEWDADIPSFARLMSEAAKADALIDSVGAMKHDPGETPLAAIG